APFPSNTNYNLTTTHIVSVTRVRFKLTGKVVGLPMPQMGPPPVVPPNQTVVLTVELDDSLPAGGAPARIRGPRKSKTITIQGSAISQAGEADLPTTGAQAAVIDFTVADLLPTPFDATAGVFESAPGAEDEVPPSFYDGLFNSYFRCNVTTTPAAQLNLQSVSVQYNGQTADEEEHHYTFYYFDNNIDGVGFYEPYSTGQNTGGTTAP